MNSISHENRLKIIKIHYKNGRRSLKQRRIERGGGLYRHLPMPLSGVRKGGLN
jgi:hypothetical protein